MRGFWGLSEASMVHGGWGVPAVLGGTSVPLCGVRGHRPHIGHFARSAASAEEKNALLFLRSLSRKCLASCVSGPYDLTYASRVGSDHLYEVYSSIHSS